MAINPGIALGVQPSQPLDMLGAYGKAMSIKNLVDGARLQQQQGAALSQKMQFDQQDNALSLAGKKIGIRQQLASGLIALPPEQRAAQYPFFRQQYIDLTGDSNIPGEYDEGLVMQTALLGQNPDKMQEAVRMEAQRARFAALQGQAYGNAPGAAPGGMPTTTDVGDGTRVAMPMQPVDERDMTPEKRAERQMSVRDLVARDPMLIGTQFEKDATDRALQLSKEARDDAGAGLSTIKGADGNTYVVRNGVVVNGGKPLDTGRDPNAEFWMDEKGNVIPNQAVLNAKDRRAKLSAANVNQFNNTKDDFENERKLRNDFKTEPIYKAHQEVKAAYGQIGSSLKLESPAGDLAAATKIMKLLDPTSVVRESELGMAMAATGLEDRIANYANNVLKGTKLTPAQRKDFRKLADEIYLISEKEYSAKRSEYVDTAKAYKLNPERVGGKEKPANISDVKTKLGEKGNPYKIRGDDGYNALPSGSYFTGPDGVLRQKP